MATTPIDHAGRQAAGQPTQGAELNEQMVQVVYQAAAPTVNDDVTKGYYIGYLWIDTTTPGSEVVYQCVDNTTGASVWTTFATKAYVDTTSIPVTEKGAASGVATLDASGLLTATQLGASSLAASGYQKLPSGLIIQWGFFQNTASGSGSVAFPIAFPIACLGVQCTLDVSDGSGPVSCRTAGLTVTGFNYEMYIGGTMYAHSGTDTTKWLAIGY
jgi:hypothetical protein